MKKLTLFLLGLLTLSVLLNGQMGSAAELRGYWTLDNLTTGIQNQGTNGAASDMSIAVAPTLTSGIIGSALQFDGATTVLRSTTAGNVGDELTSYPFSLSAWVNKSGSDPAGASTNIALGFSDISVTSVHYGAGILQSSGAGTVMSRNTTFDSSPFGPSISDGQWHQVLGVFNSASSIQLYVDGVLVGTDTSAQTFNNNVDSVFIGGLVRTNSGLQNINSFGGKIDDAGVFDDALTASDAALINGLGQIGGFGLDLLDEAQDLILAGVGSTATFGGYEWSYVDNLTGSIGDYGGSLSGFNAFIVTSDSGNGLFQVTPPVPEPNSLTLASLGLLALWQKRRKKTSRIDC